jgi:DnaK suppressor protein
MNAERQKEFTVLIQNRLTEIEDEINATAEESQAVAPDVSIGRLSRLDSMQHQQMALAGKRRLADERGRLFEALRRIDTGAFGKCLLCGHDIADERLKIKPDAVSCVPCSRPR